MMANEPTKKRKYDPAGSFEWRLWHLLMDYGKEQGCEFRSAIRDTLTDLRHICDEYGLDFDAIDHGAHQVYLEELQLAKEETHADAGS